MPSSALLASRARTRATTGHLSPPRARGVDRRRRRQRTKGAPRVASGLQPRRGKQRKERASRGWHRPGVMFKRLFGAKDAGGGGSAAPTGGGGGAGGKNTLSAVEKLKDVRAPAPTSRDRVPPGAESARNIASNGTRLVSPADPAFPSPRFRRRCPCSRSARRC